MLTTSEVCDLCGLPVPTMWLWVKQGVVVPAVLGSPGRGRQHQFDARQVLALAIVGALYASPRGTRPAFAAKVVRHFEGMSDEGLDAFLGHAKAMPAADQAEADRHFGPPAGKPARAAPDNAYTLEEVHARLARAEPVVRALLKAERAGGGAVPQRRAVTK